VLAYLDHWEASVKGREGPFDDKQRSMMLLPQATRDGIRITGTQGFLIASSYYYFTVSSFVELVPYIFSIHGATCFFSNRINQDTLEKFFGMQRQSGRSNENPTVSEFIKNTENFRVISSIWIDNVTGNCRGRKSKEMDLTAAKQPLRKRQRKRSQ